jgi:TonB-linked SusC/RagA family outer membrane protein
MVGMLLFSAQLLAQNRTITGRITDQQGNAIPDVSVQVKGTNLGTVTNATGNFTLVVPASARTLVITSVNMASQEVAIGTQAQINVTMQPQNRGMEEVVVTGYTRENRSRFVGAASTVGGRDIETVPMASFDQILQGMIPGVLVNSGSGQPGSSARVVIRGVQSLSAAFANPLYVVDGMPMEAGSFQALNPNDFESVTVLKDASAAALYGSRAAAGVIVITTKKGRAGTTVFTGRTQFGFTDPLAPSNMVMMNSAQKLLHEENNKYGPGWTYSIKNPAVAALPATSPATNPFAASQARYAFLLDSLRGNNLDFMDILFRTGRSQSHELNVSGGSERTRFYLSGNYFDQEGTDLRSSLDRYNMRFNMEHTFNKFTVSLTNTVGFAISNWSEGDWLGNSARNPFQAVWRAMPYEKPYLPNGDLNWGPSTSVNPRLIANTLEGTANTVVRNNQLKLNTALNLGYEIARGLTLRTTVGVDGRNDRWLRYIAPLSQPGSAATFGRGANSEANEVYTMLVSTTGLSYGKQIASRHDVEASAWFEVLRNWQRGLGLTNFYLDPRLPQTGQGAGTVQSGYPPTATSAKTGYGIRSFFGITKYTFDNRYTVTLNGRIDETSRIVNPENRTFYSWSAGAVWNAMRENFMSNQKIFTNLRVRGSYGITPNINSIPTVATANYSINGIFTVPNYHSAQTPSFGPGNYAGSPIPGLSPTAPGNRDLKIENVVKANIGFEAAFWNNRIQLSADFYKNKTQDLFVNNPLAGTAGFARTVQVLNAGMLTNKGIELVLGVDVIRTPNVTWNVNVNHAINKNKIEDLGEVDQYETGTFLIQKGLPYGTHYTYHYLGADPATGRPVYKTQNGGLTTNLSSAGRFATFGNFNPVHVGGINTDVRVKSLTLSVLMSYQFDVVRSNNMLNWVARSTTAYASAVNQLQDVNDRQWLKPGDVSAYPFSSYDRDFTSSDLQDAKFLRLRNVTLSYSVPQQLAQRMRILKGARFYVMGQNLMVWSPWMGLDPEDNNNISLNEYPNSRTMVVGLDINF